MARVLQLVRPDGTDVALIRDRLALDSGLASRFLRSLEREKLIETETDPADRRRQPVGTVMTAVVDGGALGEVTLVPTPR